MTHGWYTVYDTIYGSYVTVYFVYTRDLGYLEWGRSVFIIFILLRLPVHPVFMSSSYSHSNFRDLYVTGNVN